MSLIVMKFGGTSVGTAERIRQSARLVVEGAQQHQVTVVVSALSGVTDLILRSVTAARKGAESDVESLLREMEVRHQTVMDALLEGSEREPVRKQVHGVIDEFRSFCRAVLLLRSTTPQVLDVALPMGEEMSAYIFAATLRQLGAKGEFVDSSRVLLTDDRFGDASPDMEGTRRNAVEVLLPLLQAGSIPVVTGFSGANSKGQPTTLGRGGSDSSATIIGAALDCDEVWIWTDVDGVLTADPRICPGARSLPEITYAEAIELSYYGAKVIHHKAMRPVMDAGIPIWIKNSFQPRAVGTKIAAVRTADQAASSPVKAVTAVVPASLVTLTTRSDMHYAEVFGRLFLRFGHDNTDVLFSTQSSSENSLGLVLRDAETEHVSAALHKLFRVELKHGVLDPIRIRRDIAVIAVLGETMRGTAGVLGRLFTAVAGRNVSVIAVAQGASELNICFAVEALRAADAVRAVHDEFLGRDAGQEQRWGLGSSQSLKSGV